MSTLPIAPGHYALLAGVAAVAVLLMSMWLMQRPKPPHIGVMLPHSQDTDPDYKEKLKEALKEQGLVEGKTIKSTWRHRSRTDDGDQDQFFEEMAKKLVEEGVELIVVASTPARKAACKQTRALKTPIVVVTTAAAANCTDENGKEEPVQRVTGSTLDAMPLAPKQLELLLAVKPEAQRIAVLLNPKTKAVSEPYFDELEKAAPAIAKKPTTFHRLEAGSEKEIVERFDAIENMPEEQRPQALVVSPDALYREHARLIAKRANKIKLPSMFSTSNQAKLGGLLAYGEDYLEAYERAASYVERLLRDRGPQEKLKPGQLPIERPSKIVLAVNRTTAAEIGVTLPLKILVRADQVWETAEK